MTSGVEVFGRSQWRAGLYGYTMVELMIAMSIILTLSMIVVPQYMNAVTQARVAKAIGDIAVIGREVQLYWVEEARFPASLAEVGFGEYPDPYGRPYEYLDIAGQQIEVLGIGIPVGVGKMRLDRFQIPVNSDFDLYSLGKDGLSEPLMIAWVSLDDIVRAADGGFIGLAEDF